MDIDRLTNALAVCLTSIVPVGFRIIADNGMLWYSDMSKGGGNQQSGRTGTYIRDNFGLYGESEAENVIGVSVQALSEVQDYISEVTGLPWPSKSSQPSPHGSIEDSQLRLWYGEASQPVLSCANISLNDLQ
jgi:hypothetical protein